MNTKLIITFFLGIIIFTGASAQVITVAQHAKTDFGERYKNAKDPKWTNNVTYYICKFKDNGVASTAYYHLDGYWNYTERMIDSTKVPAVVKDSFGKSKYRDWKAKPAVLIEDQKNGTLYRYEVKKGIEKKYVFFDREGKLFKVNATI